MTFIEGLIVFTAALALGLLVGFALGLVRARKIASAPVCLDCGTMLHVRSNHPISKALRRCLERSDSDKQEEIHH